MSIGFLAAIKAGINTLTGRLTSARATALDNLNATVSSRAAASTALSSSTWTGTRAGYLDKIGIKSIQSGSVSVTLGTSDYEALNVGTLGTAVDTTKSIVFCRGIWRESTPVGTASGLLPIVALTSSTSVACGISRQTTSGTPTQDVHYTVVEFNG